MKKLFCILMTLVLTASTILSGCSGDGKKVESSKTVDPSGDTETKEPNEWGWLVPEETLNISVYPGYGDQVEFEADEEGGKAKYDKWLLDNMNVKIDLTYYSVDMNEKLNLMLATNDYPDVITWMPDDMAEKFIAQGKAIDLTDLMAKYGGNITRRMGDYINMLYDEDGKIYKLAQGWGETPNVAGYDFGVRNDYWLELGDSEIYKTPDEYFDTMTRILKNHPSNENGQKTYAFTSDNKGLNFLNAMLAAYGFVNGYKKDKTSGEFTHWLNTEEGLEIAKFMNKCYRNGLIDPDYLTNGYEEYVTKLSSGQVLGNLGTWWYAWTGGHQVWAVDEGDAYNINKRIMNVSLAAEGVDLNDTTLLTSKYTGSYRCIITDKCKNPELVLKWLNWENSELGNMITGWGAPAEENVWNIDENGNWVVDDALLDVDKKEQTYHAVKKANGGEIYMMAANTNWLHTDGRSTFDKIDPRIDRLSVYDYWPVDGNGDFSNEGVRISWQYYKAPVFDLTLYEATFNPEEAISITKQTITDKITVVWAKIMTAASEEECVTAFEAARDECNTLGLKDLAKYYQTAYENNLVKMGN
jgi:putative aldouronate transport system substrate-binding protein